MTRSRLPRIIAAALLLTLAASASGFAQTLRIAMTAADIPTTSGIPNNGGEGYRFLGFTAFDGLINWDFTHPQQIAGLTPGLATAWKIDPSDHTRWIFTLRQGVKFTDGTPVTADSIIWNLQRLYDEKSPQFDPAASAIVRSFVNMLDHWQKIDDHTIAIYTKYPFSFFPYMVPNILIVSPTEWQKSGKSWTEFAKHPAGTGPFQITKVVLGQFAELTRNANYWDKTRIPKLKKMVVIPMPEATTRLAALRSGEVDWIEVPPPDAIPSLKAAGFQISLWPYPHVWPYMLKMTDGSPFKDERVRQALNYAIDRDAIVKFLNGTAKPSYGLYPPGNPYFGSPELRYGYDPDKGEGVAEGGRLRPRSPGQGENHDFDRRLRSDAARTDERDHPATGQADRLRPAFRRRRMGHDAGRQAQRPRFARLAWRRRFEQQPRICRSRRSCSAISARPALSPNGINWGHFYDPKVDELLTKAQQSFDPATADGAAGAGAWPHCRRCAMAVHCPRSQSAGLVGKGKGISCRRRAGTRISPMSRSSRHC